MLAAELYRRALEQTELVLAREFAEGDYRTGEGDCTNGRAKEQLQTVARRNGVAQVFDDAQRLRLNDGGNGNEHGCEADHAVHEGDQLRHFGHFDALGHDRASCATDQQADNDIADTGGGNFGAQFINQADRSNDRQAHAEHAEQVAATRSGGVRQALEGLNEAD